MAVNDKKSWTELQEADDARQLRAFSAFDKFSDAELHRLVRAAHHDSTSAPWPLIHERTPSDACYILLSGDLEVRVGGKRVASITRVGDVFGELALVNQDKRLASVVAASKAICLAVDQKFLQDIHPREEDPDFHAALYQFVARLVAKKLDATSRRLAEVEKELKALKEAAQVEPAASPSRPTLKKPKRLTVKKKVVAKAVPARAGRALPRKR